MRALPLTMDLATMLDRIEEGSVDLQPEFQRGEVWDVKRRQRLIDTLLREWYVPAIHLVQEPDRSYSVLDGQQRLVAIRDFFAGKFAVDGTIDPPDARIAQLHGKKIDDLPTEVRRALRGFPLAVVNLTDYTPGEPNELFFRLNQSYNLTPPEKRNALHGPARNQVRELVKSLEAEGLLQRDLIGFSNQRLAYDDVIARACVAADQDSLRRHINNTTVERYYRSSDEFVPGVVQGIWEAGRALRDQAVAAHGVKFNKGTLQTWLLYCYWTRHVEGPLPHDLLRCFEADRQRVKRRDFDDESPERRRLLAVLGVYDDRASYRVTDVSSVVARDFAIHLYSAATFGTPPRRGSEGFLRQLMRDRHSDPAALMFDFLDQSSWGEPMETY